MRDKKRDMGNVGLLDFVIQFAIWFRLGFPLLPIPIGYYRDILSTIGLKGCL